MESKTETLRVSLHGPALAIVKRCGPDLSDVLQSKFGCVTTIEGVDFESDFPVAYRRKPTINPEKRFSVELKKGIRVSVWKADLTNLTVDAVVNAANSQLQHYGGLAQALSEAGGPGIQQECDDYIQRYGDLQTGSAYVSKAGLLQCQNIIHAVGPKLPINNPDVKRAEHLLQKAIRSILDSVEKYQFKTVAIPAISSGLFNYPLDQCAKTIVSTVKRYYENYSSVKHVPDEIMLVNHDEPTVKEMDWACRQILGAKMPMSYSQAAGNSGTQAAKTSAFTIEVGNVLLTLMKGHIEEQQADVIVNTISTTRDLQIGKISRVLSKKAGPEMQREIKHAPHFGHMITTRGHLLQCKEVYHFSCPESKQEKLPEILRCSVWDCLMRAGGSGHRSISFPAIGTGALGLDKKNVAINMCKAVSDFAKRYQDVMIVNFVIFPSDDDIFKVFEKEIKNLQESFYSFPQAYEKNNDTHDIKPPQISLMSNSEEAIRQADRWLNVHLFNPPDTVHINNNFIQHFGEQEYKQLTRLNHKGVSLEERFLDGHTSIAVKGHIGEDVVVAALKVESMLCIVQKEFVSKEKNTLLQITNEKIEKREIFNSNNNPLFLSMSPDFQKHGLQMLKIEEVKNLALQELFELKKKQLKCFQTKLMIQLIPGQFCEMLRHIGFHAEYAPPKLPSYGEGIYFARSVDAAMDLWKNKDEKYLYFVEAKVVTGISTTGKPGLLLPPAKETDPPHLYDSVTGKDVAVIFSGYQALPIRIITCRRITKNVGTISNV